ncbi:MAG: thiamine pyrophosphate-dependent enzyme, partial [Candidatus Eisenbacteria bacterium]|nr:thiamine pyrophosphate-dependent enzyme [Candidatus Eisenbacteria bacterium]
LSAVSGARPRRLRLPVAVPRVVPSPDRSRIEWAAGRVAHAERGLILAGPDSVRSSEDRFALLRLARLTCFPVLADVASGIRFPAPFEDTMAGPGALLCSRADAFLRAPALRRGPAPDLVLWWGELPTSKAIREYLVASRPEVLRIQRDARVCDPDGTVTGSLLGDTAETASLLADLMPQQRAPDRWRERFLRAERAAGSVEREVGEADAVRLALAACPAGAAVVLSNSMPVRWAETYAAAGKYLRVFVQRGANGIDGIVSTAFGIARGTAAPLLLVTGDLAFLHDLGGLRLARYARAPVAILLLDNEGGGIFAHLPIAQFAELDPYFRTPHGCDLAAAAEVFGLRRVALDSPRSTPEAVDLALSQQTGGTMLLHLKTDASEAAKQHRERMERVAQAVGSELPATRD